MTAKVKFYKATRSEQFGKFTIGSGVEYKGKTYAVSVKAYIDFHEKRGLRNPWGFEDLKYLAKPKRSSHVRDREILQAISRLDVENTEYNL